MRLTDPERIWTGVATVLMIALAFLLVANARLKGPTTPKKPEIRVIDKALATHQLFLVEEE